MPPAKILLFGFVVYLGFVLVESGPAPLQLSGIIYDQAPDKMAACGSAGTANGGAGFSGTDFELPLHNVMRSERELVGKLCRPQNLFTNCGQIGADRTPVYAYPNSPTGASPGRNVQTPTSFYHWFHSTPQTLAVPFSLSLSYQPTTGMYKYSSDDFYPLDGIGWNDHCYGHNYAFCFEAHARFTYQGGEIFQVSGQDDIWVYIDDKLVIDLGGLHLTEYAQIDLATTPIPGLIIGGSYRLDFFFCERHSTFSSLSITTNFNFYCAYTDWCGVCEGNGQSCCTPQIRETICNDNNPNTIDTCAVMVSPITNPSSCVHTPAV